jgi:hypothetical protein
VLYFSLYLPKNKIVKAVSEFVRRLLREKTLGRDEDLRKHDLQRVTVSGDTPPAFASASADCDNALQLV